MDFKDRVKISREKIGKTLEEVAKEVGVSPATISRYESGEIENLRRDKIYNLAQSLQVSPAYLMGWEEKPAPTKLEKLEDEFPEGIDVLRRSTKELSPAARKIMIKHMNQFIDDLAEMEKDEE